MATSREARRAGLDHGWCRAPWGLAHRALAYLISSETFIAYNLVNCLMLGGAMTFLYGILRRLNVSAAYGFLISLLFLLYPVNPMLLTMRALLLNFSLLSFLAAVFFILDYIAAPTRAKLAGAWLALTFNVVSYESAYILILIVPLLWWLRARKLSWTNANLLSYGISRLRQSWRISRCWLRPTTSSIRAVYLAVGASQVSLPRISTL